ncbi:MAG: 1-acyl-sn-glycerol-3-phosphate acyltransferase [Leptospirales bacterium]|nr:1-acyl-sn-glycerol-3-phosphate acyltransferase [Leptospirales bacterium]
MARQNNPLHLIRSLFLWVLLLTITFILALTTLPFGIFGMQKAVHAIATFWGRTLAFLSGMRIEAVGVEKIYRDGPVIYLANHQSMFDIPVFYSVLNTEFRWMAKASLFQIPFVGWGMRGAGYIPVERGDRKKAMESLFQAAQRIQKGASVIIFPEGTRSENPDEGMLDFKKGAFVLAKKANVTIQPVTIWGAHHIMPAKQKVWIQRIYPGLVQVEIHDPIPPEAYADASLDQLSDRIRETIGKPMKLMGVALTDSEK